MNCYEAIDVMGDALEGRLPSEHHAGFAEHMDECDACRTYYEQLRATVGAVQKLPKPGHGPAPKADLLRAFRDERDRR